MCKGQKQCNELGVDIKFWSKQTPLQPPRWVNNEILLFEKAYKLALENNIQESIELLKTIKNSKLQNWYIQHGQVSGRFRKKALQINIEKPKNINLDELRSPDKYRKEVFKRDNYTCQYCGGRVIPKEIFIRYEKLVGRDNFQATGTNLERHGVVLMSRANADHIIPWTHGGKTNTDNLITSCWSCNYGKSGFTLEEIGLVDPRENDYSNINWEGLLDA